jgi:Ca2+-transporting ATPase
MEVAVSLGVAAIPEGLTALATSVLALSSRRMRQKGTLIRTLSAAEALGSVTVVCADKTGTLTENRMAARQIYAGGRRLHIGGSALSPEGDFTGDDGTVAPAHDPILREALIVGVLCSDAELETGPSGELVIDGSATEGALQIAAAKAGLAPPELRIEHPRLDLRDRADGRRHMVTVHRRDGELQALLKGSPEEVLGLCDTVWLDGGVVPLDDATRTEIAAINADMAGRAMRVLALAQRSLTADYAPDDLGRGLTFLGLIGLVDPIRPAVPGAIKALHAAGIWTVMITGDQALTATAVAQELGLARDGSLRVLEAGDLHALGPDALHGIVRDVAVFARVPPEMKLEVVRALQANGNVVAMTGDGVNDGPALRAADVGVAMGERGTELALELSDVVLSTDDFTLMVDAVEEGRLVRANVRRVLHYLLSTNLSEIWVVAGAVAIGLPTPLTPLQLLWLNLVTDIAPGLGLSVEPRDADLMQRPARDPSEPIIPWPMLRRILGESGLIALGALGAYGFGVMRYGIGPVAQTMAFASLLGAQLLHVLLARAGEGSILASTRPHNRTLMAGMAISAGLQFAALFFPPVRMVLGGAALPLADLGIAAIGAVAPIALIESERLIRSGRLSPRPRALPRPAGLEATS